MRPGFPLLAGLSENKKKKLMRTYNFIKKVNAARILQRFRMRYTKDMREKMHVSPLA